MAMTLEHIDMLIHPPYHQMAKDEAIDAFMPLAGSHLAASMRAAKILGTETSLFMQTGMFRTSSKMRQELPDLPETFALQQFRRGRKNAHGSVLAWASGSNRGTAVSLEQFVGIGTAAEQKPNDVIRVILQYDQNKQDSLPIAASVSLRLSHNTLKAVWMKDKPNLLLSQEPRGKAVQELYGRLNSDRLPQLAQALMAGMFTIFAPQIRRSYASTEGLMRSLRNILAKAQ